MEKELKSKPFKKKKLSGGPSYYTCPWIPPNMFVVLHHIFLRERKKFKIISFIASWRTRKQMGKSE